jgi:hypothetical protein
VRGDRNAGIVTQVDRSLPPSQRAPVPSRFRPADPIQDAPPDVLLDIPNVSVDKIRLLVENLVALDARVGKLVKLTAGVDAGIQKVEIDIDGVQASALLIVRLDNVREIVGTTIGRLDHNPQVIERLLTTVDNTVNTVGGVANTALQPGGVVSQAVNTVGSVANTALQRGGVLSQTVNTLGQTVTRSLDVAGNVVEQTLDQTGKVLSSRTVARLLDLPVLQQGTNSAGQLVRVVRDTTGALIELTLDGAGQVAGARVLSGALR